MPNSEIATLSKAISLFQFKRTHNNMTITITNPNDLPKVLNFLSEIPSVEIKLNKTEQKALDKENSSIVDAKGDENRPEEIVYSKRLLESAKNGREGNVIKFQALDEVNAYFGL